MLRLRLFRILLPGLLLILGAVVLYSLTPRRNVHGGGISTPGDPEVGDIAFEEWVDGRRSVTGSVGRVQDAEDGSLRIDDIRELTLAFEEGPIHIRADHGDRRGEQGSWLWSFADGVDFHDPLEDLRLKLPVLSIDEAEATATSEGEIRFSAPGISGGVDRIVYGLEGQPARLTEPRIAREDGSQLNARHGVLHDGFRDVELSGGVEVERRDGTFSAESVRVRRDERDRLRQVEARGSVRGVWRGAAGEPVRFAGARLDVERREDGELEEATLGGGARVIRADDRIEAPTIRAVATVAGGLRIEAGTPASARTTFAGGRGNLSARGLDAEISAEGELRSVRAEREVVFESPTARAEAERATYVPGDTIRLTGHGGSKARMATGSTRVAGDELRTDPLGTRLEAQGRVEATLLPLEPGDVAGGPFSAEEAIHFLAERMIAEDGGERVRFVGTVRGWQGERNLAADTVEWSRTPMVLAAYGDVESRVPRRTEALRESDFVQVSADRLDYDERESVMTYDGSVRMRFAEGRLEAGRLEVELDPADGRLLRARAFERVHLEIERNAEGELAEPIEGKADRLVYLPDARTVKLIGDRAPAEVRRAAEGATTAARVLLYRLDRGSYEVEAGGSGPATILTPDP